MAEERVQRRLAAILAADVVGYSGMMHADEAGTLALLKSRRKAVLEPLVNQGAGRIFKVTGDGVLIDFASAVNAVQCAVEIQNSMAAANRDLSDDRHLVLRIGIHLGDVMVEGGDLYGDGVNIAARLESIAEPGTVYLSEDAYRQVRGKVKVSFDDLGSRTLKNISQPVRTYRVASVLVINVSEPKRAVTKPSISILPFTNMSGESDQQYFSDGITQDIITELSRFHELYVLAQNASLQPRSQLVDVRAVGRELGANYVVEGSVRKIGARIRIAVQLIDVESGNHLWAERYDRDQQDMFEVQDKIVRSLVGTLVGRLHAVDTERSSRKPPKNMLAYDYLLRANAQPIGDIEAEAEARRCLKKAIELDPNYGYAHGLLAYLLTQVWFRDTSGSSVALDRALDFAKSGGRLDETNSHCQQILGWVYLVRQEFDLAEHHYQRGLDLNPNSAFGLTGMGDLLMFIGRPDEAIEWYKKSRSVDPHFNPSWWWRMVGNAHFIARRYDEAIAAYNRSENVPVWAAAYIAASHALCGRVESAQRCAAEVLRREPEFSIKRFVAKEPFKFEHDRKHLSEGLREAGLPE
jgi:TolB-like protein